jgi:hypothetical protein
MPGTNTSRDKSRPQATGVRFAHGHVYISLSDGREIGLPLSHRDLRWLREASPKIRANWTLEPGGRTVYWPTLQDGIEVEHLLKPQRLR